MFVATFQELQRNKSPNTSFWPQAFQARRLKLQCPRCPLERCDLGGVSENMLRTRHSATPLLRAYSS